MVADLDLSSCLTLAGAAKRLVQWKIGMTSWHRLFPTIWLRSLFVFTTLQESCVIGTLTLHHCLAACVFSRRRTRSLSATSRQPDVDRNRSFPFRKWYRTSCSRQPRWPIFGVPRGDTHRTPHIAAHVAVLSTRLTALEMLSTVLSPWCRHRKIERLCR